MIRLAALFAIAGCATAPRPIALPSPGVPTSVISLDRGDCSSFLVRPAMYCRAKVEPRFVNSCDWRCAYVEPRQ